MKKIISLLIATALSVTAFASFASAAQITSSNKATLAVSCVEIDESDALDDIADFISDAGLVDYSVYQFTITAGNLPELTKSGTKYTGEGITAVAAKFTITSSAEFESEWNLAVPAGKGSFLQDGDDYIFSYAAASDYKKLLVAAGVTAGDSQDIATFQMVVDNGYEYDIVLDGGSNMNAAVFSGATVAKGTDPYNIIAAAGNITVDSTPIVLNGTPVTTTYIYTFKTYDGETIIASDDIDEGDDVIAPTAPTREGFTFAYWSDSEGGSEVTVDATAIADTVYYAVYTKDAVVIDPVVDVANFDDTKTGLTDLTGKSVDKLTKNYGIAKFNTALDSSKKYYVDAEDVAGDSKSFDVDLGEINGAASFFAIVRSSTHVIKTIKLREE